MREGWEKKKLEDISEKIMAGGDKPRVFSETVSDECKVPVYANGVQNKGLCGYTNKATIHDESITISARGTIGFCCVRNEPFVPIVRLITIIPKKNVNIHYLNYVMNNLSIENNGVAIPQLTVPMLKGITIPIPPLPEQERIVAELDCLSSIIEKQKEQLKELDNLAQSIFYNMFGDPISNNFGWDKYVWNDILKIVNGKNQSKVEVPNGEYPIYGSGGVMGRANDYLCPANTVIIGRKGNINKPLYVREKMWNVDTAFGLVADHNVLHPTYLYYYCIAYDFEQHNKAVTIPSLTKIDLLKISTPVPPLMLQQEFASKIEAIEEQKELIKQSIAETETLFNSRMDYYFN